MAPTVLSSDALSLTTTGTMLGLSAMAKALATPTLAAASVKTLGTCRTVRRRSAQGHAMKRHKNAIAQGMALV